MSVIDEITNYRSLLNESAKIINEAETKLSDDEIKAVQTYLKKNRSFAKQAYDEISGFLDYQGKSVKSFDHKSIWQIMVPDSQIKDMKVGDETIEADEVKRLRNYLLDKNSDRIETYLEDERPNIADRKDRDEKAASMKEKLAKFKKEFLETTYGEKADAEEWKKKITGFKGYKELLQRIADKLNEKYFKKIENTEKASTWSDPDAEKVVASYDYGSGSELMEASGEQGFTADSVYRILTTEHPMNDIIRRFWDTSVEIEKTKEGGDKTVSTRGEAFKKARAEGKEVFEFEGKKYNTMQKGETKEVWKAKMKKARGEELSAEETALLADGGAEGAEGSTADSGTSSYKAITPNADLLSKLKKWKVNGDGTRKPQQYFNAFQAVANFLNTHAADQALGESRLPAAIAKIARLNENYSVDDIMAMVADDGAKKVAGRTPRQMFKLALSGKEITDAEKEGKAKLKELAAQYEEGGEFKARVDQMEKQSKDGLTKEDILKIMADPTHEKHEAVQSAFKKVDITDIDDGALNDKQMHAKRQKLQDLKKKKLQDYVEVMRTKIAGDSSKDDEDIEEWNDAFEMIKNMIEDGKTVAQIKQHVTNGWRQMFSFGDTRDTQRHVEKMIAHIENADSKLQDKVEAKWKELNEPDAQGA